MNAYSDRFRVVLFVVEKLVFATPVRCLISHEIHGLEFPFSRMSNCGSILDVNVTSEICELVHGLSPEGAEHFLKLLKGVLSPRQSTQIIERDSMREGFKRMAKRVGLEYDSIPKNGSESGGIRADGCPQEGN